MNMNNPAIFLRSKRACQGRIFVCFLLFVERKYEKVCIAKDSFLETMIMKYDIAEKLAKLSLTGCCLKRNVNWQAIRD